MIRLQPAAEDRHFEQILALQARYHASALPAEAQAREGFVYARHSLPLLRRMAAQLPQAVALDGEALAGYCLALPLALSGELPALAPMFEQLGRCRYRGRPLGERAFFLGGQVCVDRPWRGQGLIGRLYDCVARHAPPGFELCVTEIALRNPLSLRAHLRIGFEELARYAGGGEEWSVVARPLRAEAAAR